MMKMSKHSEFIKQDIIDELTWDEKVDASRIKVKVNDSEVELTGLVGSFKERTEAVWDAWAIKGVKNVVNNLKVNLIEGFNYPADSELKSRIDQLMAWDFSLDQDKIDVSVINGEVILEGAVDNFWKVNYAENKISWVSGIREITNKIAVAPRQKAEDEVIAKKIMDAIERKLSVSTDQVLVTVEDGIVKLEGEVPTYSALRDAYTAAANRDGVTFVENKIRIV